MSTLTIKDLLQPRGPRTKETVADYFWDHVDRNEKTGCWLWTGTMPNRKRNKYGIINIPCEGRSNPTTTTTTRRVSAILAGMDVPNKSYVITTCSTPECINPDHLVVTMKKPASPRLAPEAYNARKGRENRNAKLTDEDVMNLRKDWRDGVPIRELSERYGIVGHHVSEIARGNRWSHLPFDATPRITIVVTQDDVPDILARMNAGESMTAIAKSYGVSLSSVSHLLKRYRERIGLT